LVGQERQQVGSPREEISARRLPGLEVLAAPLVVVMVPEKAAVWWGRPLLFLLLRDPPLPLPLARLPLPPPAVAAVPSRLVAMPPLHRHHPAASLLLAEVPAPALRLLILEPLLYRQHQHRT